MNEIGKTIAAIPDRDPVAASHRVDIQDAMGIAVAEAERARNIRHARMFAAVLETIHDEDRRSPRPEDMPRIYRIMDLIDEIAAG